MAGAVICSNGLYKSFFRQRIALMSPPLYDVPGNLIIYIDGIVLGGYHVIAAVGVDIEGRKHILGVADGATENATVAKGLLEGLVERGIKPDRRRLFVIDGSKALRSAIDAVYGASNPVQRCHTEEWPRGRSHKVRNVMGHLPDELKDSVKAVIKAAYRLDAKEGMARLKKQADLARDRVSLGRHQPAGGSGRDVHRQHARHPAGVAAMPVHHQPDRESACQCAARHSTREPLEGRQDGDAMGGLDLPRRRETLPTHLGLPRPVDAQSNP